MSLHRRSRTATSRLVPTGESGRPRALLLAAAILLPACGDVVDLPPPAPLVPLVESILVAGDTIATFRVRLVRSDAGVPGNPAPGAVDLRLSGPAGVPATLVGNADSADRFEARLLIEAGGRYRLAGAVAGIELEAETVVPGEFAIAEPAGDTVRASAAGPSAALPFRWTLGGATAVVADSALFPPGYSAARTTAGQLLLASRPAGSIGPTIRLWAINLDAERYLLGNPASISNVRGGFGSLGGAVLHQRVVRWE